MRAVYTTLYFSPARVWAQGYRTVQLPFDAYIHVHTYAYTSTCMHILSKGRRLHRHANCMCIPYIPKFLHYSGLTLSVASHRLGDYRDQTFTHHPDGSLTTTFFHKKTITDQYLVFESHHPLTNKVMVAWTFLFGLTTSAQPLKANEYPAPLRGGACSLGQDNHTLRRWKPLPSSYNADMCLSLYEGSWPCWTYKHAPSLTKHFITCLWW